MKNLTMTSTSPPIGASSPAAAEDIAPGRARLVLISTKRPRVFSPMPIRWPIFRRCKSRTGPPDFPSVVKKSMTTTDAERITPPSDGRIFVDTNALASAVIPNRRASFMRGCCAATARSGSVAKSSASSPQH